MPVPFVPKDRSRTEHIGTVERLVFASPSRDFCILLLTDGATVLGMADGEQFPRGTAHRFLGRWEDDPARGPRFRFQAAVPHIGHGRTGIVSYLTKSCTGIGEKTAERLWAKYGQDAVKTLRESPDQVADDLALNLTTCREASHELQSAQKYEATRIDLFALTNGRGFSGRLIDAAIEKWGVRAPTVIKRNPFSLLGLPSAGFKRCDRLWSDLGLPKDSLKRSGIIAWNLVKNDGCGHTWIAAEDLAGRLRETAPGADVKRAFRFAIRARKLKKYKDAAGTVWLAAYHRATSEERIAANIKRLTRSAENLWPDLSDDKQLSTHQRERVGRATASPVGLLIGSPGSGKTYSVAALVRRVLSLYGRANICLAAPTGKAAVRMTQAMQLSGIDLTASTIHRLLEIGRNGHDGDGWGFLRNRGNPLDAKFVVIDEFSMVDTCLAADLLDALADGTHLLIVGDKHQLPPVGHGAPLRDLMEANLATGELTEIRRNAGQIVHACTRIKNGETFEVADRVDLDAEYPLNMKLVEARDDKSAADALAETLKRMTKFDPVWQTQVIVARNTKGDICRKVLNERLHPMLNPDGVAAKDNPFKVGDKIICTRNSRMHKVEPIYGGHGLGAADPVMLDARNYDVVRDPEGEPEQVYIANGEIGRVIAVAPKLTVARFSEGESLIKIPMGRQKDDEEEDGGEQDGGGGRGCNFDLAYAVTGHRMQGSQSPCVIVMGDAGAAMLTTREWIYTAISRASKLCILIGQMSTFDKMRSRVSLNRRKTFLKELVQETLTTKE